MSAVAEFGRYLLVSATILAGLEPRTIEKASTVLNPDLQTEDGSLPPGFALIPFIALGLWSLSSEKMRRRN